MADLDNCMLIINGEAVGTKNAKDARDARVDKEPFEITYEDKDIYDDNTTNKTLLDHIKGFLQTLFSKKLDKDGNGNDVRVLVDKGMIVQEVSLKEECDRLEALTTNKADNIVIAGYHDGIKTYSVGDYCIDSSGYLWRCKTQHSGVRPEEGSYWTQVTVGNELKNRVYSAGSNITQSGNTFSLTKANVTNALGYTPPTTDTNTWRGIQNNLTSTSTTDSLSANQGRLLNNKITTGFMESYVSPNITPAKINTQYSYQNNVLKNRQMIGVVIDGPGFIMVHQGQVSRGFLYTQTGDQYWGGEVQVEFNMSTGTVYFKVIWIGSSQSVGNFKLKTIYYTA